MHSKYLKQICVSKLQVRVTVFVVLISLIIMQWGIFSGQNFRFLATESVDNIQENSAILTGRTGVIKVSGANIRTAPKSGSVMTYLYRDHSVTLIESVKGDYVSTYYTDIWYKVEFENSGKKQQGYVLSVLVMLDPIDPKLFDDFEKYLDAQGFPESYKKFLREVHNNYPKWIFEAYHTNLYWDTLVEEQHVPYRSLIWKTNDAWKSTDDTYRNADGRPLIYDWQTNIWFSNEGSAWQCPSREVIAYYLDPRNFISNSQNIFQFERLDWFNKDVHNAQGLESVLKDTFMSKSINGFDQAYYCESFLQAANHATISPYHLASRARQEVNSWPSTPSPSVMGYFPPESQYDVLRPYEGHYNFYNIGATPGTGLYGNVANGLDRAMNGWADAALNIKYNIPWTSPVKSIIGGATYIREGYIDNLQYTNYYQRFNVINNVGRYSFFRNQYMTNVQAPYTESRRMYQAYAASGNLDSPIVFSIPIYLDMPENASPRPEESGNPNNWIKSLKIDEKNVTPIFDPAKTTGYSIILDGNATEVEVVAVPASDKSKINNLTAGKLVEKFPIEVGDNNIKLTVTAENGKKRVYEINVVRKDRGDPPSINSEILTINNSIVTGLIPEENKNSVAYLKESVNISSNDYQLLVIDYKSRVKNNDELLVTGDKLHFERNGYRSEVSYDIIIYGDVNGDGEINTIDMNDLFRHIMRRQMLDSPYLDAGDIDRDGEITTIDMNDLFRHIMRRTTIDQH